MLPHIWQRWLGMRDIASPRQVRPVRRDRRRPLLRVERLEHRLAPATVFWNAAVSGNWTDGSKWSTLSPPTAGDTVVIDKTGTAYTVTLNADETVAGFTLNSADASFSLPGRTFTVNGDAALDAGSVTLANSTWAGTGTLTNDASIGIQNTSVISSPFVQGSTGSLGLGSYNDGGPAWNAILTVAASFGNAGTITMSGGGRFANATTQSLTVANGSGTLTNTGTITIQPAGGHTLAANLINDGTVNVDDTTSLASAITNNGSFSVVANMTLTYNGGSGQTFNQAGGTLDVEGSLQVPNSAFTVSGGTVAGAGSFNVTSGGTLNFNASTDMSGPAFVLANAALTMGRQGTGKATFVIEYACTLSAGSFAAGQNVTIAGYADSGTGTFIYSSLTAAGSFTSAGTITLTGGGRTSSNQSLTVANGGTLTNTGTLNIEPGSAGGGRTLTANLINDGTLNVDTDTSFALAGGVTTNNSTVNVATATTLTLNAAGGQSFIQAAGTLKDDGSISLNGGSTNAIGGTDAGSYSQLAVSGSAALDGTLNTALANGFTPQVGQTFQVMTFASGSGAFATQTGAGSFRPAYGSGNVTLLAIPPATPPTATFTSAGPVSEGSTDTVSFANQTDPAPADITAGFHYAYDFGNTGTFARGNGTYAGSVPSPSAIVPASFLDHGPGMYAVRGRIIDQGDAFTDYTTTITVIAAPPTATFANGGPVAAGSTATVSFTNQSDPSAFETAARFRYAYDFDNNGTFDVGDGTYAGSSPSATANVPATFLTVAGPHTIRGRIIDLAGSFTDYTTTITIVPSPATHFSLAAAQGQPYNSFNLMVTAQDQYGNTATGYTGTPQLNSSDKHAAFIFSNGPSFTAADQGVHVFGVFFSSTGIGTQTITVTDANNSMITGTTSVLVAPTGPTTFTVTNTTDSGPGSLRQAILDANNHPNGSGTDTIAFDILATDPQTIHVGAGGLPQITDPAVIDGTKQPGFAGIPLVVLDGGGRISFGLDVTAGGSTIKGLVVGGFTEGIFLEQFGGNVIQGNYVGIDTAGRAAANLFGIVVSSDGNTIGGTTAAARNIISGNALWGVDIYGGSGNTVQGNFIGTDAAGTHAVANSTGVYIYNGAHNNTIGGNVGAARNVISGNSSDGVSISGDSGTIANVVEGNFIGTDVLGTHALANVVGVALAGPAGSGNVVGGTVLGSRNVISGNSFDGVFIDQSSNNLVQGNFIGTDVLGSHPLPNYWGVAITGGSKNNMIGGIGVQARNILSGNKIDGVFLGTGATSNLIKGNYIGTDVFGVHAVGNLRQGVEINGTAASGGGATAGNLVGGTEPGAGNVIAGNNDGVQINSGATGNQVLGNFIGTDRTGMKALGNTYSGVSIFDSPSNTIGGTTSAVRNILSGNGTNGVFMSGSGATGNTVLGNYIGTDRTGNGALANGNDGVHLENGANGNTIGGTDPNDRNIIAGNAQNGVHIGGGGTTGNKIRGNYIGTDRNGTSALANGVRGVQIDSGAANNLVGGANPGARNVISGNTKTGVYLSDTGTTGNTIQGNYIGTDVSGAKPLGNSYGVYIENDADSNTIGALGGGPSNIISGNLNGGVVVRLAASNRVVDNYIGTDPTGSSPLPNDPSGKNLDGVDLLGGAVNNVIGAAGAGNVISGNGFDGVFIGGSSSLATGNLVQANYIGTDAKGKVTLPNQANGVHLEGGAQNNIIGGTDPTLRNIISGNGTAAGKNLTPNPMVGAGVQIADFFGTGAVTGNMVEGNFIGTDFSGTLPLGNLNDGVILQHNVSGNTIGGATAGAGNLIAGNTTGDGVTIDGSGTKGNTVAGNLIGDVTGAGLLYNQEGVVITDGANENTVGGIAPAARNVISGNWAIGVNIGNAASQNSVQGNYIGPDPSGSRKVATVDLNKHVEFQQEGVFIDDAMQNTIGGTTSGAGNLISGNLSGIYIYQNDNGSADKNVVQGNLIGLDVSGTHALTNIGENGILIWGASSNTIGGTVPGARNVISGNGVFGILVNAAKSNMSNSNTIEGNFIGTDLAGLAPVPNGSDGVALLSGQTTIGGTLSGAANVISGNAYDGIYMQSDSNTVQANLIGTDATGAFALPNGQNGVEIAADNTTIGGPDAGDGNVVSGNTKDGIFISAGSSNKVQGNFIGTDSSGTFALGNGSNGVEVQSGSNTIGGAGAGNIIAANGASGVLFSSTKATGNFVQGNFIGTDVTESVDLGNGNYGVSVTKSAAKNTIGGTGAGLANAIAFNHLSGVFIDAGSSGNLISGNAIFANRGLGIALNGFSANNGQPAPKLTSLTLDPSTQTWMVQGTIAGTVGSLVTLEFFANAPADSAQGRRFLVLYRLLKIPSDHSFQVSGLVLNAGEFVTATATDVNNNTSAFSGSITAKLVG